MHILGIETSCDETAAAVVTKTSGGFFIRSNVVLSQINIHKKFGGVVPEVAARHHTTNIIPVVNQALENASITPKKIGAIAVTYGPGLITSLIVGLQTAKTLAYSWQKPLIGIDHMRAHIYANWAYNKKIAFPAMCLVVSGGHTELVLIKNERLFKKIGQTIDDAAGEAFDKVAQLLNLPYPGGPAVSKRASQGNTAAYNFPRPMLKSGDYNFSFSGLKTAVRYQIEKTSRTQKNINDTCAAFEQAVIDTLVTKTMAAAEKFKCKTIMISGGVAANVRLRAALQAEAAKTKRKFSMPDFALCTDNAAMIAVAGFFEKPTQKELTADPNLEI